MAVNPGPPPKALMLVETPRALWTLVRLARHWRGLKLEGRGDGRPVLLLPGLFNSERSLIVMHRYLSDLGYTVHGWGLGRNLGVRATGTQAERLIERVAALHAASERKVTLVGVSLGGIMARLVAHRRPDLVAQVITVSSPFAGSPLATNVWRQFEWLSGEKVDDPAVTKRLEEVAQPLSVPSTAIWSRSDGLVNGTICREGEGAACNSVEVRSSHLWVQMHPDVLRAIARALRTQ
jgi:triacylglycerol lipase